MSPPSIEHADLNGWLASVLRTFVEQKNLGRVLGPEAPIRLALQAGGVRRRVPDLLFVRKDRQEIIRKNHIEGPPDLIIEIVSPESLSRDLREKYLEYQAAGVREYWAIDPNSQVIEASSLGADGKYVQIPLKDDRIASTVVDGWFVKPAWLWSQPRARVLDVLPDLGIR